MNSTIGELRKLIREELYLIRRAQILTSLPNKRVMNRTYFGLKESYIKGTLGIDVPRLILEGRSREIEELILREHLLFEGFWANVKEKVVAATKENPITKSVDAIKKFGKNFKAIQVILASVVADGGSAIDTIVKGATKLTESGVKVVTGALDFVEKGMTDAKDRVKSDKMKALVDKSIEAIKSIGNFITAGVKKVSNTGGWKGMFGVLAAYLGVSVLSEKIGKIGKEASKMLSDKTSKKEKFLKLAKTIKEAFGESGEGESEPEIESSDNKEDPDGVVAGVSAVAGAFKSVTLGFLKKVGTELGMEALSGLAGPAGWLKSAVNFFSEVTSGAAWVSEKILETLQDANFKPISDSESGKEE